jgi:hypothetical protein
MTPEQIWNEACHRYADSKMRNAFVAAARWADSHPQWHDAQGDNVPEYGREVIVIGRDGKVFYGHRPDPKEVTMVEGKPYHAKTYDKNGWNWPDIALWLDVEVPDELIDKITTEYFKENEQPPRKEE